MFDFFKGFLSSFTAAEHVSGTQVKFTYDEIRNIAAPAPVSPDPGIPVRNRWNAKGTARHAWLEVAAAISETRCHGAEQTDLNAAYENVKQIAFFIEDSPCSHTVTFERKHLTQLFHKTVFLKEIAKHQAEKGSRGAKPYVVGAICAENVTPLFEDNTKNALRASGRRNGVLLNRFAEKIEELVAPKEPQAKSPERDDIGVMLNWGGP